CQACMVSADCLPAGLGSTCTGGPPGVCTCVADGECTNPRTNNCQGSACVCGNTGAACPNGQVCVGMVCGFRAGFPCHNNSDCASGACTSGTCGTAAAGTPCMDPGDCTSGVCNGSHQCT